jgi:hypothetical protein
MKKGSSTYGLSIKKVVELLNIGSDVPVIADDTDQNKAQLLSDRLNETHPLYYSSEDKLSRKLKHLRHTIVVLAGEPIGKLLLDPGTDITIIKMIKDYCRKLSKCAKSEAEHHTANTIYYAAIAHALIFHNLKITRYTYKKLHESFYYLSKENWIPKWLLDLFIRASEYCKVRVNGCQSTG